MRALLCEHRLSVAHFILPLFIKEGRNIRAPIGPMPGHFQLSLDELTQEISTIQALGIPAVMLFGIPSHKDDCGSAALKENGIIQRAIKQIKAQAPGLLVITDVCLCEYTRHGHCGLLKENKSFGWIIDHETTCKELAKQAVSHALAGADVIAPSGMIDGMVAAIRNGLDLAGFSHIPILSYAVKYASALYAPFRAAAEGAPQMGDRCSHQMDPANGNEALREAELDVLEGADLLMVKPAQTYLDIIHRVKQRFPEVPLAGYQVSGEYAMIKAAAKQNWIDEKAVALESLLAIKRAGADLIVTYYAKEAAQWLTTEYA